MKRYLAALRLPFFLVLINFFFVNTLFSLLPFSIGNIVYNIGRISIIFYAGWLVRKRNIGGQWKSAAAGVVVYFVDHVLIKGGVFLLNFVFKPQGLGLTAFGGVLVSFVLFIPLAMLIGYMGGILSSRAGAQEKTDS